MVMPQSFADLKYHLIFSTKGRLPRIVPELASPLYEYIGGIVRNLGGKLLAFGGMPDHVHLLVSLGRDKSMSEVMRLIKTNSSKWLHETRPDVPFAWQDGYGAFTVSHSRLADVTSYISGQEEHHRTKTFEEEFHEFFRKHGIAIPDEGV